jgi:prevent-host-death family protein
MYKEIGAFDAKAKLSELLRSVRAGESFTITVRGVPVADLVPYVRKSDADAATAVSALQAMPKIRGASDQDIADWIAEGRP